MWDSAQFELQTFCEGCKVRSGVYMGVLKDVLFVRCASVARGG